MLRNAVLILCLIAINPMLTIGKIVPGTISGKVTDPLGAVISGAIITLYFRENTERLTATTDTSGQYRFQQISPGEYFITVEANGFPPVTLTNVQVLSDSNLALDIALSLETHHDEVVITASGRPQTSNEVSKALTVINAKDIQHRGESRITEILRPVAGLRVQQRGSPGSLVSLRIRGLRNADTAVLIDGLRFRDAAAPQGDATGFLSDILLTDTDSIEILRGAGSSLYGTNAIGGVINIISTDGGGRTRGSLLTEGGSLGWLRGRAQLAGGSKTDRLTYSLGLTHLNVSQGVDGDDASRNSSGQGRLNFRISPSTNLSARIFANDSFLKLNTSPQSLPNLAKIGVIEAVPLSSGQLTNFENGTLPTQLQIDSANFIPAANDPDSQRVSDFFSTSFVLTQKTSLDHGYTLAYHTLHTNRTNHNGPAGVSFQPSISSQSDLGGRLNTIKGNTNWKVGSFNFVDAGYEFESEKFINTTFSGDSSNDSLVNVSQQSHSLFVQDQLRLLQNQLQISVAFRSQFFSLKTPALFPLENAPYQGLTFDSPPPAYTGDGSIAYFINETDTKIRTHIGNGYRSPSLFERFGTSFSSFGYSLYGDPRLRPDRSIGFDTGLDQSLFNDQLLTYFTYFYTRLQETIVFDTSGSINPSLDPFGRFMGYRNSQGGLARGLELGAIVQPVTSLNINLSYTYTNADQHKPLIGNTIKTFVVPDHQWSLFATQSIGLNFFVNLDLAFSTEYLAPIFDPSTFSSRVYQFDGIAKADLGISYRLFLKEFQSLRLFGRIDNFLNQEYYENGFRNPSMVGVTGIEFRF